MVLALISRMISSSESPANDSCPGLQLDRLCGEPNKSARPPKGEIQAVMPYGADH
jgi:hypothetical protein